MNGPFSLATQAGTWPYYGAPNHANTLATGSAAWLAGGGTKQTNTGLWDERADNHLPAVDPESHSLTMFLLPTGKNRIPKIYTDGGDCGATLCFLYDQWPMDWRANTGVYLKSMGCNTIVFTMINLDGSGTGNTVCSPYVGNNTPVFDDAKLARWEGIFQGCYNAGLPPCPIWLCDDRRQYIGLRTVHQACINRMVKQFDKYVSMWLVGLESSKFDTDGKYTDTLAKMFKDAGTKKPVGTHCVYNHVATLYDKPNIDFVALEASWNPGEGVHVNNNSAAWAKQVKDVIAHGKPVIGAEYNVWSTTPRARAQGRAACAAGAYGAFNGF